MKRALITGMAMLFLPTAGFAASQSLDIKVDQLVARNPLNKSTTINEGNPLDIRCYWTVRLLRHYWETKKGETWTNAILIDGKVVTTFKGSIPAGTCFGSKTTSEGFLGMGGSKSTNCGKNQISGSYGPFLWNATGIGTHFVMCKVNTDNQISDGNKDNDTVLQKIVVIPGTSIETKVEKPPARTASSKPLSTSVTASGMAGAGSSGKVKSCRTSLSATIDVDKQQFVGPMFGPADTAQTKLTLYLQTSEAAANHVNCYYASHKKDIPKLVVTVQCKNAAVHGGQPNSYACTN